MGERTKMTISKSWLEKQNACVDGVKWFLNQEETDGLKVVEKLVAENKLDWANWLVVRVMDED